MLKRCVYFLILGLWSCGNAPDDDFDPNNEPQNVTNVSFSGEMLSYPINTFNGSTVPVFNDFDTGVIDAEYLAQSNFLKFIGGPTGLTNCVNNGCTYDFPTVDIGSVNQGIMGYVVDKRKGNDRLYVNTVTGFLHGKDLEKVQQSPQPVKKNMYAISRNAEAAIAQFMGKAAGFYEGKGFIVGRLLDKNKQPVEGVFVEQQNEDALIFYVRNNKLEKDGVTDASGMFMILPSDKVGFISLSTFAAHKDGYTWKSFLFQGIKQYAQIYDVFAE